MVLQKMLAGINSGQFREGTSDGKTTDNVFSWNVNGSRTSDFEMRYKVTIRWSERGVEKDLESTITRLDIKDRI